ncbi:somatostatin receptor type 2-like [Dendronephthya gigantea]|uniref:somatostatin receptor type 2-like n=1 Tax=Dendronephthya gigantea TaxID=151771 RepID=UPI00106B8E66|nr:somatostatin receptor type 2-like [Dendronephthya gigantea]
MAQAVLSVFLAVIAVLALLFGNTLVVIMFIKNRQWLKKAHTCLLLALAIQDIMTTIGLLVLPGFVLDLEVYSPPDGQAASQVFCSVIWSGYIPFSLAITSVYTCVMLTIDRWFAALKPMSYRRYSNSAKVIATMLIFPWVAGFGLEVTAVLNVRSDEVDGAFVCSWRQTENSSRKTTIALVTFFGLIMVPAIMITIAYTMIIIKLRRSSNKVRPANGGLNRARNQSLGANSTESFAHLRRLNRVACAASTIVIVCWLPNQLYYCLFQLEVVEIGTPSHDFLVILAFMNTVLNPLLYSFSNKQYREEFKLILCCKYGRQSQESNFEETAVDHNLEGAA